MPFFLLRFLHNTHMCKHKLRMKRQSVPNETQWRNATLARRVSSSLDCAQRPALSTLPNLDASDSRRVICNQLWASDFFSLERKTGPSTDSIHQMEESTTLRAPDLHTGLAQCRQHLLHLRSHRWYTQLVRSAKNLHSTKKSTRIRTRRFPFHFQFRLDEKPAPRYRFDWTSFAET